ncbi:hypothetical protein CDIK_3038 [Cucumispora dikerogammari]|nr:hypothetical protein CDIK_3038 [Cucumispora dikerogammari]
MLCTLIKLVNARFDFEENTRKTIRNIFKSEILKYIQIKLNTVEMLLKQREDKIISDKQKTYSYARPPTELRMFCVSFNQHVKDKKLKKQETNGFCEIKYIILCCYKTIYYNLVKYMLHHVFVLKHYRTTNKVFVSNLFNGLNKAYFFKIKL